MCAMMVIYGGVPLTCRELKRVALGKGGAEFRLSDIKIIKKIIQFRVNDYFFYEIKIIVMINYIYE